VAYPAERIAQLDYRHWQMEQCFRDLQTTMGMEELRCRTPTMAHKELLAFRRGGSRDPNAKPAGLNISPRSWKERKHEDAKCHLP